jgi:hypothetical protein
MSQNLLRKEEQLCKIEMPPNFISETKTHKYIRYSVEAFLFHKSCQSTAVGWMAGWRLGY